MFPPKVFYTFLNFPKGGAKTPGVSVKKGGSPPQIESPLEERITAEGGAHK